MNNDAQLEQVELSIAQAKSTSNKMHDLMALTNNKNFESIILEGYFKDEASRLVLLKAEPAMQEAASQKAIEDGINAIGHFRQYLHTTMQLGRMAEKAILDDEEAREELLREGVE